MFYIVYYISIFSWKKNLVFTYMNVELWQKWSDNENVADHGQIGSDIRHAYNGLHKDITKYMFKKSMYTVINIALLSIEMLQLNWCLGDKIQLLYVCHQFYIKKNEGSSKIIVETRHKKGWNM